MLDFLKNLLSPKKKEPPARIEPMDFKDGLLRFRTDDPIVLAQRPVMAQSENGPLTFVLDVVSYDGNNKVYLAEIPEASEQYLQTLGIDLEKTTRVRAHLKVQSPQLPDFTGLTEELSVSGMRLSTKSILKPRTELELSLRLDGPSPKTLKLNTRVAWSAHRGDGMCHSGLLYQNLPPAIFTEIAHYIKGKTLGR